MLIVLIGLVALLAAILQAAVGMGYILVLAPFLLIAFPAPVMIMITLTTAGFLSLLILFAERRDLEISRPIATGLIAASAPGMVIGIYLLGIIPKPALQILVGALILVAIALQVALKRHPEKPLEMSPAGYAAGFISGVMSGSTSVSGPPLVLWLRDYRATAHQIRDTLQVCFLFFGAFGVVLLLVSHPDAVLGARTLGTVAALAPLVLAGHFIGSRLAHRLSPSQLRVTLLILVVAAALLSIWRGVNGLG